MNIWTYLFADRRCRNFSNTEMADYGSFNSPANLRPTDWCEQTEATLVTSLRPDGMHLPVIDLDVPARLVPSTSPEHSHLYINFPVSEEGLIEILEVLAKHGIVESGFLGATKARGYASVRTPWTKKPVVSA